MNFQVREVVKNKDIFKTCDLVAIRNNNKTYYILYNRNGVSNIVMKDIDFKNELLHSSEPIVLNTSLFEKYK